MSASQQPLAISPNANRLAVVYRHKFVVSSEHMEENEGQQGFAQDQIRRRDEASPSSGIVQPRQVQRGRLNTGYGHVMPQKSIAAWPFLSQPCGHATLTDSYLAGRPVAKLLGTNTANTWDEHERVNRVSEHLLGWDWTRLLVAANPARCGGSLANDRYKLPDASGPTTDN
ncbi:hypothetical protein M438DRAFT_381402 [Aureobasidium pullulans EXF-150]|uniref:Uncharacterized protein n=1 Tax=Aureobasidium pullulans EXF-150 TaxID=1043002 RepID=A0A074XBW2_AURPU|nr:uncharacterized protein M438DRAFT_381402 [Aureobasidium pullulans EXF-150]KEQ83000.1 hypothetical protein M438DRAFT_381402 [Aureobasidium pullulans EXF-150]